MQFNRQKTALILSGGGARAAYQVGVLKAIGEILPFTRHENPFPIITGSSAGAINATVVAAYAQHYRLGMKRLEHVWANFSVEQIFYADTVHLIKNSWRWLSIMFGNHPHSTLGLLDNTPLTRLLDKMIPYPLIEKAIAQGELDALCVTASSYTSGESVSFYQALPEIDAWSRHRRKGVRTQINKKHLLASAAIPLVFPAVQVEDEYYGDGNMRFLSPLSPAVHLGAEKLLVIRVDPEDESDTLISHPQGYPTIAEIAGHLLDSVLVDSLDSDLERLERINKTLSVIPEKIKRTQLSLKPISSLVISPSFDINIIARKYFTELPKSLRRFLKRIGIDGNSGDAILSYILFEKAFTQELITLGYQDTLKQKQSVIDFYQVKS